MAAGDKLEATSTGTGTHLKVFTAQHFPARHLCEDILVQKENRIFYGREIHSIYSSDLFNCARRSRRCEGAILEGASPAGEKESTLDGALSSIIPLHVIRTFANHSMITERHRGLNQFAFFSKAPADWYSSPRNFSRARECCEAIGIGCILR